MDEGIGNNDWGDVVEILLLFAMEKPFGKNLGDASVEYHLRKVLFWGNVVIFFPDFFLEFPQYFQLDDRVLF